MSLPHYLDLPGNSVICLMSPTASGKTDLAFKLYQTGRFELISVDSALVYQDMNIGTAKPTAQELAKYPHHLVDIITPLENYSVVNFIDDTRRLINEIHQRGKIPLLIGGTMMYYMALLDGISSVPQSTPQIRQQVQSWLVQSGNQALYDYLLSHDPKICTKLKPSDTQRITRAVEVHLQTGKPMSVWQKMPKVALSHNTQWQWYAIVVTPDRAWLHQRMEQRLQIMWADGLVDEVIDLILKYPSLTADMPAMRAVGYRQVLDYLIATSHSCITNHVGLLPYYQEYHRLESQKCPISKPILQDFDQKSQKTTINTRNLACQDMKNRALYATRQLAKRQYTWLKQIALINRQKTNLTIVSFESIQQVEQQLCNKS